jgi:hypothetical protein
MSLAVLSPSPAPLSARKASLSARKASLPSVVKPKVFLSCMARDEISALLFTEVKGESYFWRMSLPLKTRSPFAAPHLAPLPTISFAHPFLNFA